MRTAFVPQAYYVAVEADRAMFGGKDFFTVKVMKFFMELIKTVVVVDGSLLKDVHIMVYIGLFHE